jgi:hypothetical protein
MESARRRDDAGGDGRVGPTGAAAIFKLTTDVVSTELRVRDSSGKFIPNLTINDFEILEDGVPQKITNLALTLGNRVMSQFVPPHRRRVKGSFFRRLRPWPIGLAACSSSLSMTCTFSSATRAERNRFCLRFGTRSSTTDLVGIVSTGYSSLEVNLNYDVKKKRFNEAIEHVSGTALSPQDIIAASQTADGPAQVRHNTFVAFKTAYDMLEQAAKITDRRKAFIYLSEGYNLNPLSQSRFKNMQEMRATGVAKSTNPFRARPVALVRCRPRT